MSDGYQAHDQKELKPYIRMHSLTWLKMNRIQFLLHKFVKIRRKNFIIVSWSGEDCQIKQWWSTDQRDIKEETAWASQGDIPVGDPKVVMCLVWLVNSTVDHVFSWSGRRVKVMRDVSYRFLLKKKNIVCTVHHVGSFFPYQKSNLCLVKWKCRFLTTGPQGRPSYCRGKVKILHNLLLVLPLYLSLLLAKSGSCRSCSLRKWGLIILGTGTYLTHSCPALCNCPAPENLLNHACPCKGQAFPAESWLLFLCARNPLV